jgi:hypothetical protein
MYERSPAPWRGRFVLGMLLLAGTTSADHGAGIDVSVDPPSIPPTHNLAGATSESGRIRRHPVPGKPSLPHWTVQPLFCKPAGPDDPVAPATTGTIPPGLRAFCSYTSTARAGHVPDGDVHSSRAWRATADAPRTRTRWACGFRLRHRRWDHGRRSEDQFEQQIGRHSSRRRCRSVQSAGAPRHHRHAAHERRRSRAAAAPLHTTVYALVNMAKDIECNNECDCARRRWTSQLALGYKCRLNTDNNDPTAAIP